MAEFENSGFDNTNSTPTSNGTTNHHKATRRLHGLEMRKKLFRLKNIAELQDTDANTDESQFKKVLGTRDLISLGVGSCVGTGMYLVSGMVAKTVAGPAVVLSYFIAGVAALLSGLCYAELGVRVPHTTGSAYVYTYVTVGEFVAFVIGWNMILEYIIGTAACACALSACIDILSNSAISNITVAWAGEVWEGPPDILGFVITILMMLIFFKGVKKSVMFNNVLNVVNLASWIIIVLVGMWFTKIDNWTPFMPFGFSGVVRGAATCFYAFIGFDIIATTGEEAKDPRRSIPIAIIASLAIVMSAYVSCSAIMTLMVPYNELNDKAALVQMWGQVDYPSVQWMVSVGALAALTVSMFGSMFPMPRVAYAMAKDGLIFRFLSQINSRGVPACANLWLGLIAALCALFFSLEVLVEMMSIGTLLAYTLVDACVLILRYQPNTNLTHPAFIELFETPKTTYGTSQETKVEMFNEQGQANEESSGRPEIKHDPHPKGWISKKYQSVMSTILGTHECQQMPDGQATTESGHMVTKLFISLLINIVFFDVMIVIVEDVSSNGGIVILIFISALIGLCHVIAMAKFPQMKPKGFQTPGVPLVPIVGITVNVYLMLRLSPLTLVRFAVWMILGFITYFKYGIWESSLRSDEDNNGDSTEKNNHNPRQQT